MFFLRARPESEWRAERGVSEITVRPEVLFEGERELQAIRDDFVAEASVPQTPAPVTEPPARSKKARKRLNFFWRHKDSVAPSVVSSDFNVTATEVAAERLKNINIYPDLHSSSNAINREDKDTSYTSSPFRQSNQAASTANIPNEIVEASQTALHSATQSFATRRSNENSRELSDEAQAARDLPSNYSGFGARKTRGLFARNKPSSRVNEDENKTPTPLKNGLRSLMKAAQGNPEDSPLHGSPTGYEGTSISESFSWRDSSSRQPGDQSLQDDSRTTSPSNLSLKTFTWDARNSGTRASSAQSTLERRRGLFRFRREDKPGSAQDIRKNDKKRFGGRNRKGQQLCADREAAEQLNQMISLVANAHDEEDEDEEEKEKQQVDCRSFRVDSQVPWPPAQTTPVAPASRPPHGSALRTTECLAKGALNQEVGDLPSLESHWSDQSASLRAGQVSSDASIDSLRTASPDSHLYPHSHISAGADDWVADFSVFDGPPTGNPFRPAQEYQHSQSAVELRAHLATAERLLNTSKDSVESIVSRDNMSPLSWTPQKAYPLNASRAVAPENQAGTGAKRGTTRQGAGDTSRTGSRAERRDRQRPRSWFRGSSKCGADVFREAQTLLDILHETFPEGEIDSPGSDLRTVY